MSIVAYSKCTVWLRTDDGQAGARASYDNALIELRFDENINCFLRAVDTDRSKKEIFNLQIKKRDQYKFGSSPNVPDEFRCVHGTYVLNLRSESRTEFHKRLNGIFEMLQLNEEEPPKTEAKRSSNKNLPPSPPKPKDIDDANEILANINKLGERIRRGDTKKAVKLITALSQKGVRLDVEEYDDLPDEQSFEIRIRIRIDGMNSKTIKIGEECSLDVYPSTKVHELRVVCQYVFGFPKDHQYFFVNGHLAYDGLTMDELKVKDDSLFVLLVTENPSNGSERF